MKRILLYMVCAAGLYAVAVFFTESQAAFAAVFVVGLLLGLAGDLLFLGRLILLPIKRREH